MSQTKTVKLQIDAEDAIKRLEAVESELGEIKKSSEKTQSAVTKLARGFSGMGIAIKALGIGLVMKAFDKLSEALMKNEVVADTVESVFNSIGVVFKLLTDVIVNTYNSVSKATENFDALGRVAKNVLDIAITPLKVGFQSIKLGIQSAMLAWEKSFLGGKGKDVERIKELQLNIEATKQSIKDTATEALNSGKEIVSDFGEAVGEITNISTVVVDEFKKTFEGVTVNSIIEQGKAITATKKNYELLGLQQQRLIEQYDREAEVLRQQRDDTTLTIEERIQANEQLAQVLLEQNQAEQDAIDAQIESLNNRIKLEGDSQELRNEIFALETEKLAVQAKVTGFQSEQLLNQNALLEEQATILEQQDAERQTRVELEQAAAELGLEFDKSISDARLKILVDEGKKELAITKAKIAADKALRVGAAKDILSSIAQLAGEGTAAAKAAALAGILIDTAKGVSGAIAAGAGLPFPLNLGAIATGVASVLAGIVNAKAVLKKVPGGGDGPDPQVNVSTDSGGGGSAPSAPLGGIGPQVPNMQAVQQETADGGAAAPTQAYVVESDISNAQALQQELEQQATL